MAFNFEYPIEKCNLNQENTDILVYSIAVSLYRGKNQLEGGNDNLPGWFAENTDYSLYRVKFSICVLDPPLGLLSTLKYFRQNFLEVFFRKIYKP